MSYQTYNPKEKILTQLGAYAFAKVSVGPVIGFDVSGPSGSIPGTFTAGSPPPPYTAWNSGGDDLVLQSSGKWEFQDDGDVVWQSVDTDKLYPWNVQTWEVGPDGSDSISQAPVFSNFQYGTVTPPPLLTITNYNLSQGDTTSRTLSNNYTASTTTDTSGFQFQNGQFLRGSTQEFRKLI